MTVLPSLITHDDIEANANGRDPGNMTEAEMKAMIAELAADNARLKAEKAKAIPFGLKISEKGALSVYGLGRFPVTLYGEQWDKLDAMMPQIMDYRRRNAASLKTKAPA